MKTLLVICFLLIIDAVNSKYLNQNTNIINFILNIAIILDFISLMISLSKRDYLKRIFKELEKQNKK